MCTVLTRGSVVRLTRIRSSADADEPARRVRGQSRSPNIVPFHMLDTVSSSAIVTLYLAIFDFKKCLDLEVGNRGHSRSLKVAPFDRLLIDFLLVFYRNFVP